MAEAATILWCLDTHPEGEELSFPNLHHGVTVYTAKSKNDVAKFLFEFPKIRLVLISVSPSSLKGLLVNIREMQDRYRSVSFVTTIEEKINKETASKLIVSLFGLDAPKRQTISFRRSQTRYEPDFEKYEIARDRSPQINPQYVESFRHDPSFSQSARLTPRQRDVLTLIMQGKSNKQIARILDLTEGTVKIHCMAIFRQLGVTNRTQAALVGESCLI